MPRHSCNDLRETEAVYASEWGALSYAQMRFADIQQARGFLEAVLGDPWFKRNFRIPGPKVVLRARRVQSAAISYDGSNRILLPKWAWTDWCVLHELSHLIERHEVTHHGPLFRRTYTQLVRRYMNPLAARELFLHFRAHQLVA